MKPKAPAQMVDFDENPVGGFWNSASPIAGRPILLFPASGQSIPEMCLDSGRSRRSIR